MTAQNARTSAKRKTTTAERAAEAGAATPTDHKPAASDVKAQATGEPITVEARGRSWTIEQAALNDLELLERIGELDRGNIAALPAALSGLLGPDQYDAAKDAMRDPETGRVALDAAAEFFSDILTAANPS